MSHENDMRIDRRTAIKWVVAASAALNLPATALAAAAAPKGAGYGKDPDLLKLYKPGSEWPLILTPEQRQTAKVLCDLIIPADETSPAASSVGIVDFIDEWVSAPYPDSIRDKPIILDGLAALDVESQKRFKKTFVATSASQQTAILDDISSGDKVKPEFAKLASFFKRYRALTAGGYYTTPVGMKAIGYVGNVALTSFDGPPPEVLKKLGLV